MAYSDVEQKRAYHRNYEREHYPERKEKQRAYRQARLDQYAEYQRKRRLKFPKEALVNQAKGRAKRAGLPFNLSVETMAWPTHCPILGIELDYNKTNPGSRKIRTSAPTLDRKINKAGYVLGNVFVISHRANRIKSDATVEELRAVLTYMEKSGPLEDTP